MKDNHQNARMILAVAAEADDEFIWSRVKVTQTEMFAAGPVAIKFAYFGREGALQTRPYVTTNWVTSADDMADIMDRGRARCVCGCYVKTNDILEQALQETRQGPVQAVKQLRAAGTRLFLFQQGRDDSPGFRVLAEVTGGAIFKFNPHVEQVVQRLPGLLEAVARFAIGGTAALEARDNEAATLLLEEMNAAGRIAPPESNP